MWKRIIGYLKALFGIKMDQFEDPDVLLTQAATDMREAHAKNRERAVQAIAQKNQLQQQVDDIKAKIANLQSKAELSLKNGDKELALQLLTEKQALESTQAVLDASLIKANETVEQIKIAMKHEEEIIRTQAAKAMALKTQWKQAQIEKQLNEQLQGISMDGQEAAFQRAASRINIAVNENSARSELGKDSIDAKMARLDAQVGDQKASAELEALQIKLGLVPAPSIPVVARVMTTDEEIAKLTAGA